MKKNKSLQEIIYAIFLLIAIFFCFFGLRNRTANGQRSKIGTMQRTLRS